MFVQKDFDIEIVLYKLLMAHLSTVEKGEPRDSPVWFIWEDSNLWIFGTSEDSFVKRLEAEPRCASGIVDVQGGILKHVGIRGIAQIERINQERLRRFASKYLGTNTKQWNKWFVTYIVDPLNVMVKIISKSIVAKNLSFFRTGPNLAG